MKTIAIRVAMFTNTLSQRKEILSGKCIHLVNRYNENAKHNPENIAVRVFVFSSMLLEFLVFLSAYHSLFPIAVDYASRSKSKSCV